MSNIKQIDTRMASILDNIIRCSEGKTGRSTLPSGLTLKQTLFSEYYLANGCVMESAISAGYPEGTAAQMGAKCIKNPKVLIYIEKRSRELVVASGVTPEGIISEMAAIAFQNPKNVLTWEGDTVKVKSSKEMSDADACTIQEICTNVSAGKGIKSVKVKFHNKLNALEKLAGMMGLTQNASLAPSSSNHDGDDISQSALEKEMSRSGYIIESTTSPTPTPSADPVGESGLGVKEAVIDKDTEVIIDLVDSFNGLKGS